MKNKLFITILIAMLTILSVSKQINAQDFQWATSFGGSISADESSGISIDASGNVYTAGLYNVMGKFKKRHNGMT